MVDLYDMQGRNVASNINASNVNVAALGKGAYIDVRNHVRSIYYKKYFFHYL